MSFPKAFIFDRDGTLIEHVPYLSDPKQVRLLPGVRETLRFLLDQGAMLFLHTNQSGIGRGMFALEDAEACNCRMIELIGLGPDLFQEICIAPEHPDQPSKYRKPSPQFAQELVSRFALHPSDICYVGDRATDLETAKAAGTQGIGIATGLDDLKSELQQAGLEDLFEVAESISELTSFWNVTRAP